VVIGVSSGDVDGVDLVGVTSEQALRINVHAVIMLARRLMFILLLTPANV
jgi:hypothetical protein